MMKIGEKRSPVWDTFYQIPIEEDDLRLKKRARMIVELDRNGLEIIQNWSYRKRFGFW